MRSRSADARRETRDTPVRDGHRRLVRHAPALALVGLLLASAGVGVGYGLAPAEAPARLGQAAQVRRVPVSNQPFADERSLPVQLEVSDERDLRTAARGTVTAADVGVDAPVTSGAVALRVDDEPVIAFHTSVPLYRDLRLGDRGNDVAALQEELARLGLDVGRPASGRSADGVSRARFGAATAAAVRELQERAGVARPSGELLLERVLWIPADTVRPATWEATTGAAVPEDGIVGTVAGELRAVRVPLLPADLAPGPRTVEMFGHRAPLSDDGTATDPGFLAAVTGTDGYLATRASETPDSATAELALAEPVSALRVPATAVLGLDEGASCLRSDGRVLPVTLVGSALGVSLVVPVAGTEVPETVDVGPDAFAAGCA